MHACLCEEPAQAEKEGDREQETETELQARPTALAKGLRQVEAGAGAGTGAEPLHLKSHAASSGESSAGRGIRLRIQAREGEGKAPGCLWGLTGREREKVGPLVSQRSSVPRLGNSPNVYVRPARRGPPQLWENHVETFRGGHILGRCCQGQDPGGTTAGTRPRGQQQEPWC